MEWLGDKNPVLHSKCQQRLTHFSHRFKCDEAIKLSVLYLNEKSLFIGEAEVIACNQVTPVTGRANEGAADSSPQFIFTR